MIVEQTASLSAKLVRERSPRIFRHPPSVVSKSISFHERSFFCDLFIEAILIEWEFVDKIMRNIFNILWFVESSDEINFGFCHDL